jgi:uncharacterized damage-inducible protein DinB
MANNSKQQIEYETIDTLFRHNLWANMLLFELCSGLNDEQLNTSIAGAYGSIRDTLQHIANSEHAYLYRITTGQPYRRREGAPSLTLAELQESIRLSGEGLIAAAPKVQAHDNVEVDWEGTPRSVPRTIILAQVINHATEHRAQIMVTLTQLGIQPPDLDGWSYFDARDS